MKRLAIKILILLGATGVLPWIAFIIGQVGSKVAMYAHAAGVVAVALMKVWDLFKKRKSVNSLDDKGDNAVNESRSDPPS